MSDRIHVGRNAGSIKKNNSYEPVDRVLLWTGDDTYFRSPDVSDAVWDAMTGFILEADCPYATQAIADARLSELEGFVFTPFQADTAFVDPAADLGDGITIGGVYSMIGSQKLYFDSLCASDVSAGTVSEESSEGPHVSYQDRQFARMRSEVGKVSAQLVITNQSITAEVEARQSADSSLSSRITQTADAITSEVTARQNADSSLSTRITQNATSITSEVTARTNADSALSSRIEQTLSSISFSVTNGDDSSTLRMTATKEDGTSVSIGAQNITFSGVVTFDDLETEGSTVINGANITTGLIDADYINVSGIAEVQRARMVQSICEAMDHLRGMAISLIRILLCRYCQINRCT